MLLETITALETEASELLKSKDDEVTFTEDQKRAKLDLDNDPYFQDAEMNDLQTRAIMEAIVGEATNEGSQDNEACGQHVNTSPSGEEDCRHIEYTTHRNTSFRSTCNPVGDEKGKRNSPKGSQATALKQANACVYLSYLYKPQSNQPASSLWLPGSLRDE